MSARALETRQLGRLLSVGRALVSTRDPEEVLRSVLDAARDLTSARYAALGVLDRDKRELDRFLFVGIDEIAREQIGSLPRGHGILGELILRPEPLRLARISDHPHSYGFPAGHPPMETFLGVPVMIRGEVFGNLYLSEKQNGAEFDDNDEHLLVVLAEWAAIAIDNARSHATAQERQAELERALRGLEANVTLSRELGGETDLPRVLELVVKRARALVDAGSCIALLLEGQDVLRVSDVAGEINRGVIGRVASMSSPAGDVLRAGRSQRIGEGAISQLDGLGGGASSGLLIPLHSRGVDVGVLALFDPLAKAGFSADDLLTLDSFATGAATAISSTMAIEDEKVRLSIASSEQERQRWARELHDETLQELGALNVMLESALGVDDTEVVHRALTQANGQVENIIAGLQGLLTELRPASLDQLGIGPAVEALVERLSSRSGLAIQLDIDLDYEAGRASTRHSPELEAAVYRISQEALTNVIKHSGAGEAKVLIEERNGTVTVRVEDDGAGFEPEATHGGFGVLGMRERVALADGELDLSSSPNGGTRVRATLPAVRPSDS
jgi:signal transduction histidine kinase